MDFTNIYAEWFQIQHPTWPGEHSAKWHPVTRSDIEKYFGLTLLMGLINKPHISDYWTIDPLMQTDIFTKTMPRSRYVYMDTS